MSVERERTRGRDIDPDIGLGADAGGGGASKTNASGAMGLDRRSFVKGAAFVGALGATAGLAACTPREEPGESSNEPAETPPPTEQVFVNGCHDNCGVSCSWDVIVRDGYVVNCEPHAFPDDAEDLHRGVCMRGYLNIQRLYDANRLKFPMKRTNPKTEEVPQWEQISWEEAIDLIVEKWQALIDEYGPTSIGFWRVFGSAAYLNGLRGIWYRLNVALGACSVSTGADGPWINQVPKIAGSASTSPDSLRKTETFVFWGNNCAETKWPLWRYANMAREDHGAMLYTIDPVSTITAVRSDRHLPIKPATDGALAMALMNVIFENGWEDTEFIQNRTCAPYLVKEDGTCLRETDFGIEVEKGETPQVYVWDNASESAKPIAEVKVADMAFSGSYEVEGQTVRPALDLLRERIAPWTPEASEAVTGVSAAMIRELAERMTTTLTHVWHQNGYTHYKNGPHAALAVYALICVTGNLGKPGAGMDLNYGTPPSNPDWGNVGTIGPQIPDNKIHEVIETGKLDDLDVPLKSLLIFAGNVLGGGSDRKLVEKALRSLDFLVVPEYMMTDTAMCADLVLPVAHWWEHNDFLSSALNAPYLRIEEKVIDPLFDVLTDYQIAQQVAERLGVGEHFQGDEEEMLTYILGAEANVERGCTWPELKEQKAIRIAEDGSISPPDGSFRSENGRVNFFLDRPAPTGNYGQKLEWNRFNLPNHVDNAEVLDSSPLAQKYPLLFFSPHTKYGSQTTFHYAPWLHEMLPEPELHINPADAEARGVDDGGYIRLFNDRSELVLKAKYNAGMMPGVTICYHGWAKQYFKKGHYQELSSVENSDPLTTNQAVFDVRVEAEAYREA
jgi:molybdopterin-containing oxidoreductase family molybdopterin binding subunit